MAVRFRRDYGSKYPRGREKIRQVPGGECLPSHQKSHQTLGGVRLLAGLPLPRHEDESRQEAVPLVKKLQKGISYTFPNYMTNWCIDPLPILSLRERRCLWRNVRLR